MSRSQSVSRSASAYVGGAECATCDTCASLTPYYWDVTISNCTGACASINGTYRCFQTGGDPCRWENHTEDPYPYIEVGFESENCRLWVDAYNSAVNVVYFSSESKDCEDDTTIAYNSSEIGCDPDGTPDCTATSSLA